MTPIAQYLEDTRTSQAAFAARVGISPGRVSQLVAGARPSPELAVTIEDESDGEVPADCWGIDVTWQRDALGSIIGYTVPISA